MKKEYLLNVNGFDTKVVYEEETVEQIFIPLLKRWTKLRKETGKRVLIFMSAPPGTGKTTVAQFLETLSKNQEDIEEIQTIGLDGFHYHQEYILTHEVIRDGKNIPMKDVKGCLETFDIDKLIRKLQVLKNENIKWPVYDRNLHDVIEDSIMVTKDIVLLEGNWLLSTEGLWNDVITYCDDSIFIYAEPEILEKRLVERKMRGGYSYTEALNFYKNSDRTNVLRILEKHHLANINLKMQQDGTYVVDNDKSK